MGKKSASVTSNVVVCIAIAEGPPPLRGLRGGRGCDWAWWCARNIHDLCWWLKLITTIDML